MATPDTGQSNAALQVAPDSSGSRIRNIAVQAYVDANDGNGAVLRTVFMQAVAVWNVDAWGNLQDQDDVSDDYEWKRKLLDELRAVRLGMQLLIENKRDFAQTSDLDLIDLAQSIREEQEDLLSSKSDATS